MYAHTYSERSSDASLSRWLNAMPPAFLLTLSLIALMVKLVLVDMEAPEDVDPPKIDFPVYQEEPLVTNVHTEPAKKPDIKHPPKMPESAPPTNSNTVSIPGFAPPVSTSPSFNMGFSGMPVPQFLAAAKYPASAASRGIEGYVDVSFDISKAGTTENIRIVSAQPQGVFEKSALAAVKRWRYQPKLEKGEALVYQGMVQRIRFVMEGSKGG